MSALLKIFRLVLATFALFGLALLVTPASAQQPSSVNPTASAVRCTGASLAGLRAPSHTSQDSGSQPGWTQ